MTFTELSRRVRTHIGQHHRYAHSVRVARMAEVFACSHQLSTQKARLAGMLHDLARLYSPSRLLAESVEHGLDIDDYARAHPIVLHAPLSAALAKERFGVRDPDVLSAIAKHTLGAAQMSPLDCVLYLADSLEPGRSFALRDELARRACLDLADAMRATFASSLQYLWDRGLPPAPQTAAAMKSFGVDAEALEVLTAGHS